MNLGQLQTVLLQFEDDSLIFSEGFSNAHSYRGYYNEVAFEYKADVSVKEIKAEVEKAFTETFCGWKGGDYNYHAATPVHLSFQGNSSDSDETEFEALICRMLLKGLTKLP